MKHALAMYPASELAPIDEPSHVRLQTQGRVEEEVPCQSGPSTGRKDCVRGFQVRYRIDQTRSSVVSPRDSVSDSKSIVEAKQTLCVHDCRQDMWQQLVQDNPVMS